MAKEKIIKGKEDSGKHEGKRAEIRRIAQAELDLYESYLTQASHPKNLRTGDGQDERRKGL
jgi:hypothetical protein